MKKCMFWSPMALAIAVLLGCQTTNSRPVVLDRGITTIARHIEDSLVPGTKVAILNFSSPTDRFSNYIIEMLMVELVGNRKLKVVDRQDLDKIRAEMNFQMSGDVDDNEQQAAGKMLGAESVISGSLMDLGTVLRFTFKVLNVQSAEVEALRVMHTRHNEQLDFLLTPAAGGGGPGTTGNTGADSNSPIAVPLNSSWGGASLTPDQHEVWFRVTIQNAGTYAFETDGNLDTIMELYDGPTMALLSSDDDSGEGENARIVFQGDGGRAYVFKVRGYNANTTGPFRYRASTVSTGGSSGSSSGTSQRSNSSGSSGTTTRLGIVDVSSSTDLPIEITMGQTYRNTFTESNRLHFYSLPASSYSSITIFTGGDLDMRLVVVSAATLARWLNDPDTIDEDDPEVLGADDDSGESLNARLTVSPNGLSSIFIMAFEYSRSPGSYTITTQGSR